MKLYGSLTSPFVRKCRITALEAGIDDRLEFIVTAVTDPNSTQPNPLKLIPALEAEDGTLIVDSRVICRYLGSHAPQPEKQTWADQTLVALADGLMDRAVSMTLELRRDVSERSQGWIARWTAAIRDTLPELERRVPEGFTPGAIALICALGYLDLRFDSLHWRDGHGALADWYDAQLSRPSVAATEHPQ